MSSPIGYLGACSSGSGSGAGCSCASIGLSLRLIGFESTMNVAGDQTNMLNWAANYNIDSVAWGEQWTGYFTSYDQTEPPTQSGGPATGQGGSYNYLDGCSGTGPPCTVAHTSTPSAFRAQAYLPTPTAYYIVGIGNGPPCDSGPSYWLGVGCIFPQLADSNYPMIVDLPTPDDLVDDYIFVQQYYIGIITPGAGYSYINTGVPFAVQQDLNFTAAQVNMLGLGTNWAASIANPCYATPQPSIADPFTGDNDDP
jgi:hypothetical protein